MAGRQADYRYRATGIGIGIWSSKVGPINLFISLPPLLLTVRLFRGCSFGLSCGLYYDTNSIKAASDQRGECLSRDLTVQIKHPLYHRFYLLSYSRSDFPTVIAFRVPAICLSSSDYLLPLDDYGSEKYANRMSTSARRRLMRDFKVSFYILRLRFCS